MKHTKEEVVNALKVIKEECLDNPTCSTCPFWNSVDIKKCMVQEPVETWEIKDPELETWRAFK